MEELLCLHDRRAELRETDDRTAVQTTIEAEEVGLAVLVYELYRAAAAGYAASNRASLSKDNTVLRTPSRTCAKSEMV